jgi:RimJ/RimL family protein N-acetyltransferase
MKKANENNCKCITLDAFLENEKAHHFYEREGFVKKGYRSLKTN